MCKYCEFTHVNKKVDERSNENVIIERIKDGRQVTEVSLTRYQSDGNRINELIVDRLIETSTGLVTVEKTHIEIKYCPFCGEEL